jgi:hypothetical protein
MANIASNETDWQSKKERSTDHDSLATQEAPALTGGAYSAQLRGAASLSGAANGLGNARYAADARQPLGAAPDE